MGGARASVPPARPTGRRRPPISPRTRTSCAARPTSRSASSPRRALGKPSPGARRAAAAGRERPNGRIGPTRELDGLGRARAPAGGPARARAHRPLAARAAAAVRRLALVRGRAGRLERHGRRDRGAARARRPRPADHARPRLPAPPAEPRRRLRALGRPRLGRPVDRVGDPGVPRRRAARRARPRSATSPGCAARTAATATPRATRRHRSGSPRRCSRRSRGSRSRFADFGA